jgi:NADH-quinone oxidoreductase subunit E
LIQQEVLDILLEVKPALEAQKVLKVIIIDIMDDYSTPQGGGIEEKAMPDVEAVLRKHGRTVEELIPILQDVQKEFGYISPELLKKISRFLRVSENQVFGIASFYAQFRFTEPGRHSIKVCLGTACHVRGGATLLQILERDLGIRCGETTKDKRFDLQRVACLGCCALSPVIQIDNDIYSKMSVGKLRKLKKKYN